MSAYDPRQRREPAAPENSQQNGYFSAPTASGSAIPATPGQQPTAAFQAPYDGAREQPTTAFNASGQAPYNSVEPDPVAYQPTQAMPPVGSQPAGALTPPRRPPKPWTRLTRSRQNLPRPCRQLFSPRARAKICLMPPRPWRQLVTACRQCSRRPGHASYACGHPGYASS